MPLTIKEVLETLEDPVALGIDFYADKIHVNGENLSRVHERIIVGDILVTGGTSDLAFYDPATDVLITQKKAPPADDGDRALLLHECVHAMVDIIDRKTTITRHMGELAAYLTQTAYSVRKYPTANRTGTAPWDKFWGDLYATVRANNLDSAKGNGARIPNATLENLRQQLAALPAVNYGSFSKEATDVSNGLLRHYAFTNWRRPINAVILLCPRDLPGPERRLFDRYAQRELFAFGCEGLWRPPSQAAPRFPLLLQASRLHVEKPAFGADKRRPSIGTVP